MKKLMFILAIGLVVLSVQSCAQQKGCASTAAYNKYRNYGRR